MTTNWQTIPDDVDAVFCGAYLPDGVRHHAMLTTDHAASSYGIPVLLIQDQPEHVYGPGDGYELQDVPGWRTRSGWAERAISAGYDVAVA